MICYNCNKEIQENNTKGLCLKCRRAIPKQKTALRDYLARLNRLREKGVI